MVYHTHALCICSGYVVCFCKMSLENILMNWHIFSYITVGDGCSDLTHVCCAVEAKTQLLVRTSLQFWSQHDLFSFTFSKAK